MMVRNQVKIEDNRLCGYTNFLESTPSEELLASIFRRRIMCWARNPSNVVCFVKSLSCIDLLL